MSMSSEGMLAGQRILITGAGGQLGGYLCHAVRDAGGIVITTGSRPAVGIDLAADLSDAEATSAMVSQAAPQVVIHAAACTDVDGVEREPQRGERHNTLATANIATAASATGAYLLAVSTDMVFAGDGGAPYAEDAATRPISAYGLSKLHAEAAVREVDPAFGIARTAWLYGGQGKHFPRTVLTVLRDRGVMEVVNDEAGSPTFAGDLASALVEAAAVRAPGILHLANAGRATRFELARETARLAGLDAGRVLPVATAEFLAKYPLPAARPADSTLQNNVAAGLGIELRPWADALYSYAPALGREFGLPTHR